MELTQLFSLARLQLQKEKRKETIKNLDNRMLVIANFVNQCPRQTIKKIMAGENISKQGKYNLKRRHNITLK